MESVIGLVVSVGLVDYVSALVNPVVGLEDCVMGLGCDIRIYCWAIRVSPVRTSYGGYNNSSTKA